MTDHVVEQPVVLVVDDSATKRYLLVSWLGRAGFRVIEAKTGTEALTRLAADRIDVVILDVRLPDMTGFEVCERIKDDTRYAAIPVIHVSAHAVDVADRTEGLNRGADGYLVEPIDPEELIASVHAVLRYYRARQRAELLAKRLSLLAETTLRVNSAADLPELLLAAVGGAARIFRSPAVVVAEAADGVRLTAVVTGPDAPPRVVPWRHENPEPPVGTTVRIDDSADWDVVDWAGRDSVSVVTARLREDRPAIHVTVADGITLPGAPVFNQLGLAVAAAVGAQRSYDEEHRIAVTLQRSLLPQSMPDVPGIDSAVRYVPASRQAEVGGDFYELTVIDNRLLMAIGDVAGHSLHAATVMAEVRHAVRAYAVDGHSPGAVLERVNRLLGLLLPGEAATMCLLTLDPLTGRVRLANAGHLPPVVVTDGQARLIQHRGPLLGVRADRPADLEFTLPPGATLVLYTDGLIERRDTEIDVRLAALADAARSVDDDLDRYCGRLLELAGAGGDDDIAVLAVRRAMTT
jgi:serine phosphatase RsbU (regulator of sigma subunit)/DNA-binding NarL/FixJ family response regulator